MTKVAKSVPDEILRALTGGPMNIRQLCDATGRGYEQLNGPVKNLREAGRIVVIGLCWDHGIKGIRKDAPILALAGTPMLKPEALPPKVKLSRKSGVIAGPQTIGKGFRWLIGKMR